MTKKLKLYQYGNCGPYDQFNPFTVYNQPHAAEILYQIASLDQSQRTRLEIAERLNIEVDRISVLVDEMIHLNIISEFEECLSLNFTVILNEDVQKIDAFSLSLSQQIAKLLINESPFFDDCASRLNANPQFDVSRLLYHIIACEIFDGSAIDLLADHQLIKTSKLQKGNRDYILFGFEDHEKVTEMSDKLLCSCNTLTSNGVSFRSFGDGNGQRNDLYRHQNIIKQNIYKTRLNDDVNHSYMPIIEENLKKDVQILSELVHRINKNENNLDLFSNEEKVYLKYLNTLEYIEIKNDRVEISVPVFTVEDKLIMAEIHSKVMAIVLPLFKACVQSFPASMDITALKHNVEVTELMNELWHQVFGNINEQLVEKGFLSQPPFIEGQGRYFRAIYFE